MIEKNKNNWERNKVRNKKKTWTSFFNLQMNTSNYKIGLNIHLLSFKLSDKLIHDSDVVRVSITTFPEENKQHFEVKGKKIYCTNHVFALNITNQTDKIVLVFRKKSVLNENPIIASATLHLKKFVNLPIKEITTGMTSTDVKILDVYYPLQKQLQEEERKKGTTNNSQMKRKVLGQMEVQLSFTTPYLQSIKEVEKKKHSKLSKNNGQYKENKINISKKQKKNGGYEQINDDNFSINYNLI